MILFILEESKRLRLSQCSLEKYPEQEQGLEEVIPMTQQPRPTHCLILDNVLLDILMFPHEWLMTKVLPTCGHKYLMTFFLKNSSSAVAKASAGFTVGLD